MKIESICCTQTQEEQLNPALTALSEGIWCCGCIPFRNEISFRNRDFIPWSPYPLRSLRKLSKPQSQMLHPVTKLNLECLFVKENRCNKTVLKWERLYLNPLFHIQRFLPLTGKKYKRWFNIQSSCFCLCL